MFEINPTNVPREKQIHLENFIITRKLANLNYRIQLKPVRLHLSNRIINIFVKTIDYLILKLL